jgi:pimeloyl-ACP methyl ester carboxylesterase
MYDVIGVLDALDIQEVHLVGVSMGGMISQLVAINAPSRVKTLTSIMSTTSNPKLPQPRKDVMSHLLRASKVNKPDDVLNFQIKTWELIGSPGFPTSREGLEKYVRDLLDRGMSREGTTCQMLAILATPNRFKELGGLSMPVQVIHGTDDPLIPMAAGQETADAIAQAKLHLIKGMGHDLPAQLHERLCDLIIDQATALESHDSKALA